MRQHLTATQSKTQTQETNRPCAVMTFCPLKHYTASHQTPLNDMISNTGQLTKTITICYTGHKVYKMYLSKTAPVDI